MARLSRLLLLRWQAPAGHAHPEPAPWGKIYGGCLGALALGLGCLRRCEALPDMSLSSCRPRYWERFCLHGRVTKCAGHGQARACPVLAGSWAALLSSQYACLLLRTVLASTSVLTACPTSCLLPIGQHPLAFCANGMSNNFSVAYGLVLVSGFVR